MFLKGQGYEVSITSVEPEKPELVRTIVKKADDLHVPILLPDDVIVGEMETGIPTRVVSARQIPPGRKILDIGPVSIAKFVHELEKSRTVMWNGPMGIFEIPEFSIGTTAIATALAGLDATTIIGGGSTAEAVTRLGLAGRMTHVSTGGGATLQFLAGKVLPGIAVLADRN